MTNYGAGWIVDSEDSRDYSLVETIEQLPPQELENAAKNIRLERALLAADDDSPIAKRAMRLVPEDEWKSKRYRYHQPHYLFLPLVKQKKYKTYLKSLYNQDLFLPPSVNLKDWFSEVKDQGEYSSCAAHAGVALMEYFQRRISGNSDPKVKSRHSNLSWLFLYKVTRNLRGEIEDVGATIRDTLKAITLFGIPPERYWSFKYEKYELTEDELKEESKKEKHQLNDEPSSFCYAYAQNYQATQYFQLDRPELSPELKLIQIKIALASGFPAIFGFVPNSSISDFYKNTKEKGEIHLSQVSIPKSANPSGHAVVAVGYDDNKEFRYMENKGAFLIRNSWSKTWGENGYGWLPYDVVLKGLATDWWSMLNAEWLDLKAFGVRVENKGILSGCHCNCNICSCC